MGILVPFLLCALGMADRQDPRVLVERAIEAGVANRAKSANWLGREDIKQYDLRKGRKVRSWLTYEASKLEGESYYKLVAENGKPLKKSKAALEQKRFELESARRKSAARGGRGDDSTGRRYSISLQQLLAFHNLQYSGEDTVRGRRIWIVDSRIRDAAPQPRDNDELALCGDLTVWIDQETGLVSMQELRVTREWKAYTPGSMVRYELDWNGEVMLVSRITVQLPVQGRMNEQIYTNYRRFGSDSTIQFNPDPSAK